VEFMLLFNEGKDAPPPQPEGMAVMGQYAQELARQKKLRRGFPLGDASEGATVRVRGGQVVVTDGPFAESKEQVAGVWIIEAADRTEAVEIAKRVPHLGRGPVEVHALAGRYAFPDNEKGKSFLHGFRMSEDLKAADPAKGREMREFGETLLGDGTLIETAPLTGNPSPARLETRAGKIFVTDGPFAESKEHLGGYGLVRVPDRAAAIALAKRWPHAKWGPVEVREILFFDRV
jgi:hypothetical protein